MAVIGTSYVLYSSATTANYRRLRVEIFQKTIDIEAEKINKIIAENKKDDIIEKLLSIKPTRNSSVFIYVSDNDYIISDGVFTNGNKTDSLKNIPWDINSDSFTYKNHKYRRFEYYMDNGWLLSVQIPENEMFTQVTRQNIIFSTIMEISFVLLLVLVFFLISRFINGPIKQLTKSVAQIELGNLDMKIAINSKDEIGQLAGTFNKMTSDLKHSIEENAREREEKKRITTELSIAREIQLSFLKNDFFEFHQRDAFDIFADMAAAKEVGGDLYDFFLIDNDKLAVVIADVSGKGIPASLFMVRTKTLINNLSSGKNPKEVFELVNKKLCENNEACIFVTAIFGVYDAKTGKFSFVNAGHNPPLIKKKDGFFEYIRTKPQIVLAVMEDTEYKEEEIILEKGDTLYFYTDGVTEAMNSGKELYGEDRLKEALNKYRDSFPNDLIYNIKCEVDNFTSGAEQSDDIAMLALRINEDNQTEKQISVDAEIKQLNRVLNFITAELKKTDYGAEIQNKIEMSVEEIFTNIVNYAYDDKGGQVKIAVSIANGIEITFEDKGKPFNPAEHPDPDLEKPIKDREIGGLGLFLVKQIMDSIAYAREDDRNVLIISKK